MWFISGILCFVLSYDASIMERMIIQTTQLQLKVLCVLFNCVNMYFYCDTEYASSNSKYWDDTKTLDIGGTNMYILMIKLLIKDVLHMIVVINMTIWMYFQFVVAYFVVYKAYALRYVFQIIFQLMCNFVNVTIVFGNSHMDSLMDTFQFFMMNQVNVLSYVELQSIFILIITILTESYNILNIFKQLFLDGVVRYVSTNGSYNTTVSFHYVTFVFSTIMTIISKLMIYIIIMHTTEFE